MNKRIEDKRTKVRFYERREKLSLLALVHKDCKLFIRRFVNQTKSMLHLV